MTKNNNFLNLTYRVPITKPLSTSWKVFGNVAGSMIRNAINIMNEAITMHYLFLKEKHDYEKIIGKRIGIREYSQKFYEVSTYTTFINRELKGKYEEFEIASDTFDRIVRQAIDIFNTNGKNVLNHKASLPSFRLDQPIPVRGRTLRLNDSYQVYLPFMTAKKADELGFKGANKQSFKVQLGAKGKTKVVLDKILSGEYQISDSKVQRTLNGKWFLLLSYKQPIKEVKPDKDTIIGVDLGINKVAYMAVNNSKQNFFIDGGEMRAFRNRIRGRRKSLQHQLRACSHNRRGHGRKTLLKPLEVLREKESNFNKLANHRYSKAIVEWAEKQGAGVIQIEDLSSIKNKRKDNKLLGDWTYFDLSTKIEYKAKAKGIEVVKINPRYTSQRCNECGVINKDNRNVNRNGQELFECTTCGHRTNADLNAARNIAMKDIENIIKDQLEAQKDQKIT